MFGPHVDREGRPLAAAIAAAVARAAEAGFRARAAGVFLAGPRNATLTLRPGEAAELRALADGGLRLVGHNAYTTSPWGAETDGVRAQLRACDEAGVADFAVHLPDPARVPPAEAARRAAALLAPRGRVRILLEVPALVPRATPGYADPAVAAEAAVAAAAALGPRGALCLDTAHLWVGGADIREAAAADAWLAEFEALAGAAPLALHLNDSARARGAGPDRHAALGAGEIWRGLAPADSGLASFVALARRRGAPAILERHPAAALAGDYRVLRALVPEDGI